MHWIELRSLKNTDRADINILTDPGFICFKETLDAEIKQLKELLGDHNPKVLLDTMVYYINDLGDINSHLDEYETRVASKELRAPLTTSMLLLMVRSLFTHLKFPYAQFPCTGLASNYKLFCSYYLKYKVTLYSITFVRRPIV